MFNQYIATRPRTSRRPTQDSSAGAPKVATVTAQSKSELKELGERLGWQPGPRTMAEINAMSSQQALWEEAFNSEQYERALMLPGVAKERKNIDRQWAVRRMWEGRATPDENEKCRIAGDAFATRHPTFARTMENAMLMIEHMQAHDLDATEISSYTTAFRELSAEGKLKLVEAESADDFLAQHPELIDRRTPPLIAARQAAAQNAAAHSAKTAAATSEGSVTRLIDYGPRRHGVPPEPEKWSFKQKIRSMSASEIAQRCQDDPSFRKSLDELK